LWQTDKSTCIYSGIFFIVVQCDVDINNTKTQHAQIHFHSDIHLLWIIMLSCRSDFFSWFLFWNQISGGGWESHSLVVALWSWSQSSWIYNYECNQCLSSLKLRGQTLFMVRCTWYTNMWQCIKHHWRSNPYTGLNVNTVKCLCPGHGGNYEYTSDT
jgi:hypothetical protein